MFYGFFIINLTKLLINTKLQSLTGRIFTIKLPNVLIIYSEILNVAADVGSRKQQHPINLTIIVLLYCLKVVTFIRRSGRNEPNKRLLPWPHNSTVSQKFMFLLIIALFNSWKNEGDLTFYLIKKQFRWSRFFIISIKGSWRFVFGGQVNFNQNIRHVAKKIVYCTWYFNVWHLLICFLIFKLLRGQRV